MAAPDPLPLSILSLATRTGCKVPKTSHVISGAGMNSAGQATFSGSNAIFQGPLTSTGRLDSKGAVVSFQGSQVLHCLPLHPLREGGLLPSCTRAVLGYARRGGGGDGFQTPLDWS